MAKQISELNWKKRLVVISFEKKEDKIFLSTQKFIRENILKIKSNVETNSLESHLTRIRKKMNESDEKILSHIILSLREKFNSQSKIIISPFDYKKQINLK